MSKPRQLQALKTLVNEEIKEKGVKEDNFYNQLKDSGVATESVFHFVLKAVPLGFFLLSPVLVFIPSIVQTQIAVLLMIIDFWYTKNVSGRRMVGLRWWINFDQLGNEEWKFECRVNEDMVNKTSSNIFWITLYICGGAWALLLFFNIIKLSLLNSAICGCGAVAVLVNLYAFHKCSGVQKKRVGQLARELGTDLTRQLFNGSVIASL